MDDSLEPTAPAESASLSSADIDVNSAKVQAEADFPLEDNHEQEKHPENEEDNLEAGEEDNTEQENQEPEEPQATALVCNCDDPGCLCISYEQNL